MKVLISGGGIAGLTLAYWLHCYGHEPVIIEIADGLREDGYGIDFMGTGYDVAERMGLVTSLQESSIRVSHIFNVNTHGDPIVKININLIRKALKGRYASLMHRTLEYALYNAVKDKVEIRFGCSLTAVHQSPEAVTVTLNNGCVESYDVLVGADGVHSHTRTLVFGPEEQFAHYLGYYVASYTLPDRYDIGVNWYSYAEPGRQAAAYSSDRHGELVAFFMYAAADEGYIPRHQRLPRLQKQFAHMGWLTPQLLANAPDPEAIFMDKVMQIRMPYWSNGRVALVGDACGCLTLASGQGASLAMGGAFLLAQALRECKPYTDAFRHYENELRPHVEKRQKQAKGIAKTFVPHNKLQMWTQQLALKLLMRDPFVGLIRKQLMGESILQPSRG